MRQRARRDIKGKEGQSLLVDMSQFKSFPDLADSMLKLRETFDAMTGRNQLNNFSPLKKKDLNLEFGTEKSTCKEQECETDEEDGEIKSKQR